MDDQAATEKLAAALQAVSGPWPMRPEEFAAALLPVVREIAADEGLAAADQRAAVIAGEIRALARRYGGRDVPVSTVKVARRLRALADGLTRRTT